MKPELLRTICTKFTALTGKDPLFKDRGKLSESPDVLYVRSSAEIFQAGGLPRLRNLP